MTSSSSSSKIDQPDKTSGYYGGYIYSEAVPWYTAEQRKHYTGYILSWDVIAFYFDTFKRINKVVDDIADIDVIISNNMDVFHRDRHELLAWHHVTNARLCLSDAKYEFACRIFDVAEAMIRGLPELQSVPEYYSMRKTCDQLHIIIRELDVSCISSKGLQRPLFYECDNAFRLTRPVEEKANDVICLFYNEPHVNEVLRVRVVSDIVLSLLYT